MAERISVAEAAERMGKSQLFVREAMKQGMLPIGVAMQMPGNKRWSFHISPGLLDEYLKGPQYGDGNNGDKDEKA